MATSSGGSKSGGSRSSSGRSQPRRGGAARRSAGAKRGAGASASRTDKSVEAFRDALERSVTLSRGRLQEAVDDAVRRGRMTRDDANELVSSLLTRSRQYSDELVKQLDPLLDHAQRDIHART